MYVDEHSSAACLVPSAAFRMSILIYLSNPQN